MNRSWEERRKKERKKQAGMGVGGAEKHGHQETNGVSRKVGKGMEVGACVVWMEWYGMRQSRRQVVVSVSVRILVPSREMLYLGGAQRGG